jgi:pimeloyl-ACP methyl ester carboxylesterase
LTTVTPRLAWVTQTWCALAAAGDHATLAQSLLPWLFAQTTLADAKRAGQLERGLATSLARVQPSSLPRMRTGLLAWSGSRTEALAQIEVPALVISADEDLLTPDGEAIAAAIPGAELVAIPAAGHALTVEAASAVNAALLTHLDAVCTRAS